LTAALPDHRDNDDFSMLNAPQSVDPVIAALMRDVDRTLLRENLKLSVEQRIRQMQRFQAAVVELQRAGREARGWNRKP